MALEVSVFSGRSQLRCDSGQDRCTDIFLDASGSTRQPKYNHCRGAALRRLVARARRQTISAFEPLISLRSPLTNFFF